MTQSSAKAQEPSMEDILASIRRIIADDDPKPKAPPAQAEQSSPPQAVPPAAPMRMSSPPPRPAAATSQADIDAMLSRIDAPSGKGNGAAHAQTQPDVLELTEAMTAADPVQPPVFRTIEASSDVFFAEDNNESTPDTMAPPAAEEPAPEVIRKMPERDMTEHALISSSTGAAVDAAFSRLAHTVLSENSRTLEDLVREMMRPMLKAWLDDNLPGLVERLVRAEIERVSRGHG